MNDRRNRAAESDVPTVLVVDDDEGMRAGLEFLLASAGHNVKSFASAQEFLDYCRPDMQGCLLLDVRMPGMSGLELQEHLRAERVRMPVIIVTAFANVPMAVQAVKAGAFDFIEKPFESADLLARVHKALAHAGDLRRDKQQVEAIRRRLSALTPREREVMDLVVAGRLNKQIAAELDISMKTVENHRANVMRKMRAESLAELVRMAMMAGN